MENLNGLAANKATWNEFGMHDISRASASGDPVAAAVEYITHVALLFDDMRREAQKTHATDTWTHNDQTWLIDHLPDCLVPARYMLFSYDSSPAIGAATTQLDDLARDLLHWLNLVCKEEPRRPLVFLCHSLGGLVVKQALVEANIDTQHRWVAEATCLLVFFATPHQGGNYAGVGSVAAKLVRTVLRKPTDDLLEALKKNSADAARRFVNARHLPRNCLVISFYERMSYKKLGVIVDKASATLNLHGDQEKVVGLNANHSTICKLDMDHSTCRYVSGLIAEQLEKALLQRKPTQEPLPRDELWVVHRPSVCDTFTGRGEILESIREVICPDDDQTPQERQRRFILTGMGGLGKSEICLKVATQVRGKFWGIFWVDVSSESSARSGFLAIAAKLSSVAKSIDEVCLLLANETRNWLLILDNADHEGTDFTQYFPSGNRGAILMTSRLLDCHRYGRTKEVDCLDEKDCLSLLFKEAHIPEEFQATNEEAAKKVIEVLGSHTLAIIQAGAVIAHEDCSLSQYPELYRRNRRRYLELPLSSRTPARYHNVYAAFEVLAVALESSSTENSRDALDLLDILSEFHYNGFPVRFFKDAWEGAQCAKKSDDDESLINSQYALSSWHVHQLPDFMQASMPTWDPFRLQMACNRLVLLALVKKSKSRGFVLLSMHPLIHDWITVRQDARKKEQLWKTTGSIFALSNYHPNTWQPYRDHLRLHLLVYVSKESERGGRLPRIQMKQIHFQCSKLFYDELNDATLPRLMQNLFEPLGSNCQLLVQLSMLDTGNLSALSRPSKALELLNIIIIIQEAVLAYHGDPNELGLEYKAARNLLSNNDGTEAIKRLQKAIAIEKAENGSSGLVPQFILVRAYLMDNQSKEAIKLLYDMTAQFRGVVVGSNLSQLLLQRVLVQAYFSNGQFEKAAELIHRVQSMEKTLGFKEKHHFSLSANIDTDIKYINGLEVELLHSMYRLRDFAQNFKELGETSNAIEALQQLSNLEDKYLSNDHPDRVKSRWLLAEIYMKDGQIEEAARTLFHALEIRHKTVGGQLGSTAYHQIRTQFIAIEEQSKSVHKGTASESTALESQTGVDQCIRLLQDLNTS